MSGSKRRKSYGSELAERVASSIIGHDEDEESSSNEGRRSRGRPPIQEQWTGIISLSDDNIQSLNLRVIATDLLMAPNLPIGSPSKKNTNWKPVFFSDNFTRENKDITLDKFVIEQENLMQIGINVSKRRKLFLEAAEEAARNDG